MEKAAQNTTVRTCEDGVSLVMLCRSALAHLCSLLCRWGTLLLWECVIFKNFFPPQ